MASNRIGRINDEIQKELASLLRTVKDPRVSETMLPLQDYDDRRGYDPGFILPDQPLPLPGPGRWADDLVALLPDAALGRLYLMFPDPWPKARHHKRRLIQAPLVTLLASRLKPGGYLHCATDWEEYAQQMLEVLSAEPLLENTAADFAPRPDYRPLTKFEQRGLRLGHGVWDVIFRRKMGLLEAEDHR